MTTLGVLQIVIYIGVLVALVKPFGSYMARVYEGQRTWLSAGLGPLERFVYRVAGVRPDAEQDWKQYTFAVLAFNALGLAVRLPRCSGCRACCR